MTGDEAVTIDVPLVRRLIAAQFPRWADLQVEPVAWGGWDNRTFRLGDHMTVRLPSAACYVAQVEKEHRWLPALAPLLPLPIPVPLALGSPTADYPFPWSVYRWLDGETASRDRIADLRGFAVDVAQFLVALQRLDTTGGPPAGRHNFFRGGPLGVYDDETRRTIAVLGNRIDGAGATAVWDAALAAPRQGPAVWVHGDVAVGNLIVSHGRLSAVIDFGSSGVGDPACDLVIAWTFLEAESREAFRAVLQVDDAMWARARGWALWKALHVLAHDLEVHPAEAPARCIVEDVLAEHRRHDRPRASHRAGRFSAGTGSAADEP